MRSKKTDDPKYPREITLTDGTKILLPRQSKFTDPWLKAHGCSLVAEFEALQWLGVPKAKHWPIYLEEWHRQHTPKDVFAKVTVKGVSKGIDHYGKGKGSATYSANVTAKRINTALNNGALVIMERGNPIHTIVIVKDGETVYILNAGTYRKTTPAAQAKRATTSKRYRGMIIVRRANR
jgi:hypothetical protein